MICYDLRFPELARTLALLGAQALFMPAHWPAPRLNHWRILNIARAIENQFYVLACNRVGIKPDAVGDIHFFGHSLVIGPWGEVQAEGGEKEEIIFADIDFALVAEVRRRIPAFQDRSPQSYRMQM